MSRNGVSLGTLGVLYYVSRIFVLWRVTTRDMGAFKMGQNRVSWSCMALPSDESSGRLEPPTSLFQVSGGRMTIPGRTRGGQRSAAGQRVRFARPLWSVWSFFFSLFRSMTRGGLAEIWRAGWISTQVRIIHPHPSRCSHGGRRELAAEMWPGRFFYSFLSALDEEQGHRKSALDAPRRCAMLSGPLFATSTLLPDRHRQRWWCERISSHPSTKYCMPHDCGISIPKRLAALSAWDYRHGGALCHN